MLRRLGNVLLWASILIAGGWVWLNYVQGQAPEGMPIVYAIAGIIVLVGIALRYILAGPEKS
jgi:hypothetical protein